MNMRKEISSIAKKAAQMEEPSLKMLIFATDILLARDEMEKGCNVDKTGNRDGHGTEIADNQRNPTKQLI